MKGREGEKGAKGPVREIETVTLDRNATLEEAGIDRDVRVIRNR